MNRVHHAINGIRINLNRLASTLNQDFWRDTVKKKPYQDARTKEINPRYEIVGEAADHEDWNPHNWVGIINVRNKRDYIALPHKIEICLSSLLDDRYYNRDQQVKFKQACLKFQQMYDRRRATFIPMTNEMVEKRFREIFKSDRVTKKTKRLIRDTIGIQGHIKGKDLQLNPPKEVRELTIREKKKQFEGYLSQKSNHTEIIYDEVITKVWCKTKLPLSYAATLKVFSELKNNGFEAETMLDFGCGVGPGLWAASEVWKGTLRNYDGVDKSIHMLRMANFVVTGGHENCLTDGIRFRRRIPEGQAYSREQYNVVLVANTLGDFQSRKERLKLIDRMWNKVHAQGGVLILIENGNLPGHELVQESRSHLIDNHQGAYVVAPCGHNAPCGLFRPPDRIKRSVKAYEWKHRPRCAFPVTLERPPWTYHHKKIGNHSRVVVREAFNYAVIAKNATRLPVAFQFPRVIGKGVASRGENVSIICANGTPVPICGKRGREAHETNLQLRRLKVGDTMPIEEREEWEPTERDLMQREISKLKRHEFRKVKKQQSKENHVFSPLDFDMPFSEIPFKEFESIFMEKPFDNDDR